MHLRSIPSPRTPDFRDVKTAQFLMLTVGMFPCDWEMTPVVTSPWVSSY